MRKLWLLLLALTIFPPSALALGSLPDWVEPLAEIDVSEFDPTEVYAVKLLNYQEVRIATPERAERTVRQVYRILAARGARYGGTVVYLPEGTKVRRMRGGTQYPSGDIETVKEEDSVETQLFSMALASDARQRSLVIPEVTKGCLVWLEYSLDEELVVPFDRWGLQENIPVLRSELLVELPAGAELSWKSYNCEELQPVVDGNRYHFVVENLKRVPYEPSSPPLADIAAHMVLHYHDCGHDHGYRGRGGCHND